MFAIEVSALGYYWHFSNNLLENVGQASLGLWFALRFLETGVLRVGLLPLLLGDKA
jgi:hypothetical protein